MRQEQQQRLQTNKENVHEFYSGQADSSRPIIETFKITQHFNMWQLHLQEGSISFSSLTELAKSIPTESKQKFRLAPSDYGNFAHIRVNNVKTNVVFFPHVSDILQTNLHYYYYVYHRNN